MRILLTITAALAVAAAGVPAPAGTAVVPVAAISAPDSAVFEQPYNPYLDVAGTPSCDRRGHASVLWKLTSTIGVRLVQLTSPDAVKPVGSTLSPLPLPSVVSFSVRQSIPGTHGKGPPASRSKDSRSFRTILWRPFLAREASATTAPRPCP